MKKQTNPIESRGKLTPALLVLEAFILGPFGLILPEPASAQALVPLIALSTNQNNSAAGFKSSSATFDDGDLSVVYVDPSLITYPTILPATTIAGPAGPDVQVNDPALDHIQVLPNTYGFNSPDFERCSQAETTLAANGSNIVVSYNTTAGIVNVKVQKAGYFAAQLLWSGYSVSHDGGRTWRSGFIAPPQCGGAMGATRGDGVV